MKSFIARNHCYFYRFTESSPNHALHVDLHVAAMKSTQTVQCFGLYLWKFKSLFRASQGTSCCLLELSHADILKTRRGFWPHPNSSFALWAPGWRLFTLCFCPVHTFIHRFESWCLRPLYNPVVPETCLSATKVPFMKRPTRVNSGVRQSRIY